MAIYTDEFCRECESGGVELNDDYLCLECFKADYSFDYKACGRCGTELNEGAYHIDGETSAYCEDCAPVEAFEKSSSY